MTAVRFSRSGSILPAGLQVVCNRSGDAELFSNYAFVEQDLPDMEHRLVDLLSKRCDQKAGGRRFMEECFSWNLVVADFLQYLRRKKMFF